MTYIPFHNNEKNFRDPAEILAEQAAELAAMPKEHSILERVAGGKVIKDPRLNEEILRELLYGCLCESRGIPESPCNEIAWSLYCRGALDSIAFWHCIEDDVCAPFAWPGEQIALMLTPRLSMFENFPAEQIADKAYFNELCESAFRQHGWIVLRIDPESPAIEVEVERIAELVRALKAGEPEAA